MNRRTASTALSAVCSAAAGAALLAGGSPTGTAMPGTAPEGAAVSAARHPADRAAGAARTRAGQDSAAGSGTDAPARRGPLVLPTAGAGDGPDPTAPSPRTPGERGRDCSHDHRPRGLRPVAGGGRAPTGVPDHVTGDRPAVPAGRPLDGRLAARHAPAHRDRTTGPVPLDAGVPAPRSGSARPLPATGLAALPSAGRVPVRIVLNASRSAGNPGCGPAPEATGTGGRWQRRGLFPRDRPTTAARRGHPRHADRPGPAGATVRDATARVADDRH
ncbi:hypothetical protein [Streptomyces griseoviridis]|uniref:Uncharacterized protein n=1 Tax=Streptomyces griseoviridis TaxID=45398 RepID=A0ABT9LH68_STRGD|nr:hypothetical protein [Streptomyces griseoviridis]MDP9683066.1 hypothetical protein [Streptomyces griseoviridis]GGS89552.1 hypothetical protein GCM10010240_23670 [Streptomyces griseoviridis]